MSASSRLQAAWLERGLTALVLLPLSWLYRTAFALRGALYRIGLLREIRLTVPVVVVGNLIAGGAGKTPTTMALVALLSARGYTPGVISRGYGRSAIHAMLVTRETPIAEAGDEPLLMHLRTGVPVAVGADRVAAAEELLRRHPDINILLSDDGLQHRRLKRDAQVIVYDERGIGNGWMLPAGPLREPMRPHRPARSVVLYNASRPTTAWPGHLAKRQLAGVVLLADWWAGKPASREQLAALRSHSVLAAAGVARPQRFFDMLRAEGLQITELPLPDHHDFASVPWPAGTAHVIVTEKDAVKLKPESMGRTSVWVAALDFELGPEFETELMQWLPLLQ